MADSYILTLPDEILIRILRYLDTYDLFNYCEAYPEHSYFFHERHVISNISLHRKFQLNLPLSNLTKKIDVNHVTVFNVNGVYWIPAEELRTCIRKFHNLESLYVLDTKLFVSEKDSSCLASLPRLKKVAVCVVQKLLTLDAVKTFPDVKSLMIHLVGDGQCTHDRIELLASKQSLEELWIVDKTQYLFLGLFSLLYKRNIRRFVYKSPTPISVTDLKYTDMQKIYHNMKVGYVCIEKGQGNLHIDPTIYDEHFNNFWNILTSLHCHTPYSMIDAKELLKNQPLFHFKELNFCDESLPCSARYIDCVKECLMSVTAQKLRKLSFQCCSFEVTHGRKNSRVQEDENINETDIEYKRRKLSMSHPLNNLGEMFPYLQELEIWPNCNNATINDTELNYNSISSLKNLQKFTISVARTTPVDFIVKVLENCKKLECLRISCKYNEPFMNSLCNSLKFSQSLKDFRCETPFQMNINKIIMGLNEKRDVKLERVVLKCEKTEQFDKKPLINFFTRNPQVVFFCIIIHQASDAIMKAINRDMKQFKNSPQKVFMAMKQDDHPNIPEIHRYDMLNFESHVATCDIYSDFLL